MIGMRRQSRAWLPVWNMLGRWSLLWRDKRAHEFEEAMGAAGHVIGGTINAKYALQHVDEREDQVLRLVNPLGKVLPGLPPSLVY